MKFVQFMPRLLSLSVLALAVAALSFAQAQEAKAPATQETKEPKETKEYQPTSGQPGKDVVWVPTSQALVDKMLDMAKVTPNDFLVDLGSGDGRTVITAAKRGAKAMGIEFNPDMVALSKRNAAKEGVADKATFIRGDIFKSDFSKATVITLFLLPDLNVRLRPKILSMKPGVRVVSNSFTMGDWTPDEQVTITSECTSYCTALFWIVPAKVQGTWKIAGGGELALEQKYQMLSGSMKTGNTSVTISDGKMIGDQIEFSVGDTRYSGRVSGNVIEGIGKSSNGETKWRATRSAKAAAQRAAKQRPVKQRAVKQRNDKKVERETPVKFALTFGYQFPNAAAPITSTTSPISTPANGERRTR